MKLPCAVTRDLLPLYAENMVEQETRILIEEHLEECADCRAKLSEMNAPSEEPVDTAKPLQNLKKQIRIKRFFAAALAALCVFVCVYTYFYRTTRMDYLPWQSDLIQSVECKTINPDQYFSDATLTADSEAAVPAQTDSTASDEQSVDALVLQVSGFVNGIKEEYVVEDNGTKTVLIQMFGTNPNSGHQITSYYEYTIYPAPDRLIYGFAEPQELLWGDPLDGGVEVLPRLALAYYLMIAAGLTGLLGLLWFIFRKWNCSWVLRQLFFAPLSYVLSHVLLKGLKTTSFFMQEEFFSILLAALAIYALFTITWQMFLTRRKEA